MDSLIAIRGRQRFPVESVEDAARKWVAFRDRTFRGVSVIGNGLRVVNSDGAFVARVSYNGRIWDTEDA